MSESRAKASIHIQWKGTHACFDFYCVCGESGHYDGYGAYSAVCPLCGATFDLPMYVDLFPYTDNSVPVEVDMHV